MLPVPVQAKLYLQPFYQTKGDGGLRVSSEWKRRSLCKLWEQLGDFTFVGKVMSFILNKES
jgi:hypothetical protein